MWNADNRDFNVSAFVILSLHERLTREVILTRNLRRRKLGVVRSTARLVDPSSLHSLDQDFIRNFEIQNGVDGDALRAQHLIQLHRLRHRSREPIQDETISALWRLDGLLDDADDDVIRHERAALHGLLRLDAVRGLGRDRRAKHVTGGEMAQAVLRLDFRRLCALFARRETRSVDARALERVDDGRVTRLGTAVDIAAPCRSPAGR